MDQGVATPSPALSEYLAELASVALFTVTAVLHFGRFNSCGGGKTNVQGWDWKCKTDSFSSLAFFPLHVLAMCAYATRSLLVLWGGYRCCRRANFSENHMAALRMTEIFIGAYTMCWFAPDVATSTALAASDTSCLNKHDSCAEWATSGECNK